LVFQITQLFFFFFTIIVWYFKPLKLINMLVTWCSLPTLVSSLDPCFLNFGPHTHNITSLFGHRLLISFIFGSIIIAIYLFVSLSLWIAV